MKATDRHKLIDRIKTLEGLTDDERSALLGLLRESKTYGLVWEDKPEEVEERLRNELPVLVEVKDRALTDAGPDAPNHILIEGDNLEALATVAYTHAGKIDVIYIDPPYNTGNKDFIYNDSYVDSEDSYRHSKWLSFMSRRLRIAKRLLSNRGVIFISLDDNEIANMRILCDDNHLFGEQNFIALLPRITKSSGKTTDKIAMNHDYILIYAKSKIECVIQGLPHDDDGFKFQDEHYNDRGRYKLNQTLDYDSLSYSESLDYPIEIGEEIFYPGGSEEKYNERKAGRHKRADWAWRWSRDLLQFGLDHDFVVIKRSRNGSRIYTKTYQGVSIERTSTGYKLVKKDRLKPIQSVDLTDNQFSNDNAKKELSSIFGDAPFDYPKPTSILRYLLPTIPSVEYVLDFFAGSGTTLHAVMQLNAEDGGKRQCILCTNNENGICENVTYERNKRVIQGYTKPNGEFVEGLHNNNLRYYRTDFVGRSRSTKNMRRLVQLATDMLCIKEDLYSENKTFAGLPTFKNIYRYFEHSDKKMLIIYDERYVDEIVKMIASVETDAKIKVYVFSPSEDPWEASFEPVNDKVELCALPQAIYNTYKRILPKRRPKSIEPTEEEDALAISDEKEIGGLFSVEGGEE